MEKNVIHCLEFEKNNLPDCCADLIIADPPYFGVKGDFDFGFSHEEYIEKISVWAKECARILKDNGTLIWYGNDINIAYQQVILDKYLYILNSCVIDKNNSMQKMQNPAKTRRFAASSERFLVYEKKLSELSFRGKNKYDKKENVLRTKKMCHLSKLVKEAREKAKLSIVDCDRILGRAKSWSHYESRSSGWRLIPREVYDAMQKAIPGFWQIEYEEFEMLYDKLQAEYKNERRVFNLAERTTDIFSITVDSSQSRKWGHPTVKNEQLTEKLINICTNKGALVVVPFAGSGTECAMAAKNGRDYIGFEVNEKYANTARIRVRIQKQTLF